MARAILYTGSGLVICSARIDGDKLRVVEAALGGDLGYGRARATNSRGSTGRVSVNAQQPPSLVGLWAFVALVSKDVAANAGGAIAIKKSGVDVPFL